MDDATLVLDRDMGEPETHRLAGGCAAVFSARSPGKETPNEDAAALLPIDAGSAVLAVADGLGGERAGEEAAALAVRCLADALEPPARSKLLLRDAILNGFERANRAVRGLRGGAATTLAVVEIQEDLVRPYHVGDSTILLVGQRGRIKLRTVSHSPVGFAVEAGLLDEADALHHDERHVVSNVLGGPDMRIEVGSVLHLAARDTLLLASDGLADNLHTAEIVECIRKGPLETGARRLAADALRRMSGHSPAEPCKPDDLTFVAFRRARLGPSAFTDSSTDRSE
jgi:serine/threonine protein phosphatase PrpC